MAQAQHYATQYREMEVKTADQFELVLLLYKGAAQHLHLAKQYLHQKDIEKRLQALNKAAAMIGELQTALDFEKGGEIAASLNQLYSYMLNRLWIANSNQDTAPIDEVLSLLSTLQSAWDQARAEYKSMSSRVQVQEQTPQLVESAQVAAR
jgi:flagellar protein FliS